MAEPPVISIAERAVTERPPVGAVGRAGCVPARTLPLVWRTGPGVPYPRSDQPHPSPTAGVLAAFLI